MCTLPVKIPSEGLPDASKTENKCGFTFNSISIQYRLVNYFKRTFT